MAHPHCGGEAHAAPPVTPPSTWQPAASINFPTDLLFLQYVCNMLNSLTDDAFAAWVTRETDAHRAVQMEDQCLELDPAVAEAFRQSTAISCKYLPMQLTLLSPL